MGFEVKKTEHAGPKKGNGAFWGSKRIAKRESSKIRRRTGKLEIKRADLKEGALRRAERDLTIVNEWPED